MFARVTIRTSDQEASGRFYSTVLATLGIEPTRRGDEQTDWREFRVAAADGEHAVTRGLHIGFVAPSRAHVDEFWRAGTAAGHRDDGEPGLRPEYGPDYYGSFVLDPDGNSAEAVHHGETSHRSGIIDHLWIRVTDLAAARRFYERVAPRAGFRLGTDTPARAQFRGASGSFSLVAGAPTRHVHLTFAGAGATTVRDPDGNTIEISDRFR